MQVNALDHVNIVTFDLEGTVAFYEGLLGLKRAESPGAAFGFKGAWMVDALGNAIVHLGLKEPDRDYGPEHQPGTVTGAVHHVALRCEDFDGAITRLQAMGIAYRASDVATFGLRQIFVTDPNNVNLELNFPGD
jgi:catechol 2,3-dioxygenase-like lactoylglutathione lyase family enzyme